MGQAIAGFSEKQFGTVQVLVNHRYGEDTDLPLGDSDIPLGPDVTESSSCPVLLWSSQSCGFVLMRTGKDQVRTQYDDSNQHFVRSC